MNHATTALIVREIITVEMEPAIVELARVKTLEDAKQFFGTNFLMQEDHANPGSWDVITFPTCRLFTVEPLP